MPPMKSCHHLQVNGFADTVESEVDIHDMCDVMDTTTTITASQSIALSQHQLYLAHHSPAPTQQRRPAETTATVRVLTTATLLAFCFFSISGGPTGSEEIVLAGGPFVGLVAMVVFPLVFYLPMGFVVTELATALPVSGGHAYWIALAFGPSWGFQAGYWSWVANCIDCSMYACLAVASIVGSADWVKNSFWGFILKSTFAIVLALPGLWSLRAVANIALFMGMFVLVPYAALSLWAATQADHWDELLEIRLVNNATASRSGDRDVDIDYSQLVNGLVWAFNGFSNLSMFAAHVHNPARTYWRVLWISSLLIPLTYLLPSATSIAVDNPNWRLWDETSPRDVAEALGGSAMAGWIRVVDLVGQSGMFMCALTASAFLANGMAKQGIAPTTVGLSTSSGTPHGAICCSLAVILIVVNLEFDDLLLLANALGALEAIALMLAWTRLRFTMRALRRPVKFCGDAPVVVPVCLLLVPLALYGFVIVNAFQCLTGAVLTCAFVFIGIVYSCQADYARFRDQVHVANVG